MIADIEDRVDARIAADRIDVLAASEQVTDQLEEVARRWEAAKDRGKIASERLNRRESRVNVEAWAHAQDDAERAQTEIHRLRRRHLKLAEHLARLDDPRYRQRLIDAAVERRERDGATA